MLSAQTAKLVSIHLNFSAETHAKIQPSLCVPFFSSLCVFLLRFSRLETSVSPAATVYPCPLAGQIDIFRGIPTEVSSIRRSRCHEANNVNFNLLPSLVFIRKKMRCVGVLFFYFLCFFLYFRLVVFLSVLLVLYIFKYMWLNMALFFFQFLFRSFKAYILIF